MLQAQALGHQLGRRAAAASGSVVRRACPGRLLPCSRGQASVTRVATLDGTLMEQAQEPAGPPIVFTSFDVYRQSDALTISAIPPTWKATGATGANWALAKAGVVLLTYAKGLGASGRPKLGEARFDWSNKQAIALSSVEFCSLVEHAKSAPPGSPKFSAFHDPHINNPALKGKATKALNGERTPSGYALNLSVGGAQKFSSGILLNNGELAALSHLAAYWTPLLLGFDKVFNTFNQAY